MTNQLLALASFIFYFLLVVAVLLKVRFNASWKVKSDLKRSLETQFEATSEARSLSQLDVTTM